MSDGGGAKTRKFSIAVLIEKNWFVMLFSLFLAFLFWVIVSMSQTNEVEKTFQNVSVRLNSESTASVGTAVLQIYGNTEYYVDVTVKGKSYLLNDSGFDDHIVVSTSLSSVSSAGLVSLPLTAVLEGYGENDAEIVSLSKSAISVYLDEEKEKTFELTKEVIRGGDFSLKPGYSVDEAKLSVDKLALVGPAMEMEKITGVRASVTLNGEISESQVLQATIVPFGASEELDFSNVKPKSEDPVYITVPLSYSSDYKPVVAFTGLPTDYDRTPIAYTVSPEKVTVSAVVGDEQLIKANEITVGTVDASRLDNAVNRFRFSAADLPFRFSEDVEEFTVTVDLSGLGKRWLEVPVTTEGAELPAGAQLLTESVKSVQIIGPESAVLTLESADAYAVPVTDGVELRSGENDVPVRIVVKTLNGAWAFGEYTAKIRIP